jgi:hypothetical protein
MYIAFKTSRLVLTTSCEILCVSTWTEKSWVTLHANCKNFKEKYHKFDKLSKSWDSQEFKTLCDLKIPLLSALKCHAKCLDPFRPRAVRPCVSVQDQKGWYAFHLTLKHTMESWKDLGILTLFSGLRCYTSVESWLRPWTQTGSRRQRTAACHVQYLYSQQSCLYIQRYFFVFSSKPVLFQLVSLLPWICIGCILLATQTHTLHTPNTHSAATVFFCLCFVFIATFDCALCA